MRRRRSTIYLGDAIQALSRLAPADTVTRQAMIDLLGLGWPDEEASVSPENVAEAPLSAAQDQVSSFTMPSAEQPLSPASTPSATTSIPSTVEALPKKPLKWMLPKVEPLAPAISEITAEPLPFEPLFVPSWTRAILSTCLATTSEDGPFDIDRIVKTLAQGHAVHRLYRRPWPTLRRGVQVLIDRSEALMPFSRDQDWLKDEIVRVVGVDLVDVQQFIGCPRQDRTLSSATRDFPYRRPMPGTVVLLLTDLGIGQPMFAPDKADLAEWEAFASETQRLGCPLVAFVPYSPARCPRSLRSMIMVIQWDRMTTATTVRHLIGTAHEVVG